MKKLTTLLLSSFILFFAGYCFADKKGSVSSENINVIVDGNAFRDTSVYKMSEQTKYFSVKEIAKIYSAILEWKPVSSQVTIHLNNRKIDIKANSAYVVFGRKLKKMSLPSRLIKNDIYIPPEILTSPEFAEIAEADTKWNSSASVLNVTHHSNISSVRYFTRSESTQVLVQLDEPLSYTVSKTSGAVVLKILRGKIQPDSINVTNGVIKDIYYGIDGRSAVVKINLEQTPKLVKTSTLTKPDRISIDIIHSKNIDLSSLKEKIISESEEDYTVQDHNTQESDLTLPEEYGQAQVSEFVSEIENGKNNQDLLNIPVTKFEHANIIDDSYMIVDDAESAVEILTKTSDGNKSYHKRKKIIVLDAGHGGRDLGAIGPNGTKEKNINLEIVYELKSIFDHDSNYKIILTRKDDTFIPLAERTNIANKHNADLFISVHCNTNFDREVSGFEIYYLSENATDSEAGATATLENSVLEMEGKPNKRQALLQNMLWSMTVTDFINDSSKLSGFIIAEAPGRLKIPNRGVKQANFYVLRGTQMPSILAESAFLSNYTEEAKLNLRKFRVAIADSIYEGVVKYYAKQTKEQKNK
ncbi:MAG: N-acetylmuramoyl-L-alanine amidase [Endomicrobium sp.]|uniref:N-acetylmuramoyl-L-alanine amidase n=1 Tax=Candidatus Endomicrobiellum pyrsonymphae TaxID=1408203 RepID=UPI0035874D77|nr:N-acetylmuramoyl-L-alanine amidase [Endomicrobium sp.]